jgi:hypothetical protein
MQVMLDKDLAKLYNIETRVLKQAVKRNIKRFPEDFMFKLTEKEIEEMVSQSVIPSKKYLGGVLPYVFTEQGVANLSSILNNDKAIEINIAIMRAFVIMRKVINSNILINSRIGNLERKHLIYDSNFEKIFNLLENNSIERKEGVFFEGQVFDAFNFVSDLIRKASKSIILIDNYIDDSVLTLFIKRKNNVKVIIYTENISKQLHLDLNKYNSQYATIEIKELKNCHDRFLIIDNIEIYHFGASLKDLGKKLFAFSKLEKDGFKILEKLY